MLAHLKRSEIYLILIWSIEKVARGGDTFDIVPLMTLVTLVTLLTWLTLFTQLIKFTLLLLLTLLAQLVLLKFLYG